MKKKIFISSILFVAAFSISSCGSPLKKRKSCPGNGSWYGNRNLGTIEQNTNNQDIYRLTASVN
jgi:hypothetical protein